MIPSPAWIYVIIEALLEALPLIVLGEESLSLLLLHGTVSPVVHRLGIFAIILVSVTSTTMLILGRGDIRERPTPRRARVSLLIVICVGLAYWNLSVSPLYFYYVHSLLEPLTIAGLTLAQAMLVYAVIRLLKRWIRNARLPFILAAVVPFIVTPFHPFFLIAWVLGAISGWLAPSNVGPLRVNLHPLLALAIVLFGYSLLINAVFGTFVIGVFTELSYEDAFTFDFAIALLYAGAVKRITRGVGDAN